MKAGGIEMYEQFMTDCVARLRQGLLVSDKRFWGENGHLEVISLLYNIQIYVYVETVAYHNWVVFNEEGTCGYICLLNAHDHISVLHRMWR
jgi:hypothetical protein